MSVNDKICQLDLPSLKIIHYPDRRLQEVCTPIETVDDTVGRLAERMFELMFEARGVGLAAPQAGVTVRLFIASASFEETDRRVYINPEILSADGVQESEEGCLSLPGIFCNIKRPNIVTIKATNLEGEVFEQTAEGLAARIFMHEMDHLEGRLLINRMGSVAKLASRRTLKDLEDEYAETES